MIYLRSNFFKIQKIKCYFDKHNWIKLLFTLSILISQCRFGDNVILNIDIPQATGNGKLNLQCHFVQDDSKIKNYLEFCKNATFDAIFTYRDETFVLKGDKYWKHINNGVSSDSPKLISQKWSELPSNINCAFTDATGGYIYFFKGSQYWKFEGDKMVDGYPREIKKDFPGVPDNLQASVLWLKNEYLFLFKGDSWWEVDMTERPYEVSDTKSITEWGLPGNLDAALQSPGYITYFFKGEKYYKYNDKSDTLVVEDPPYPRRVASNWFGCPKVVRLIEE